MGVWMPLTHPQQALTVCIWMVYPLLTNHHGNTCGAMLLETLPTHPQQEGTAAPALLRGQQQLCPVFLALTITAALETEELTIHLLLYRPVPCGVPLVPPVCLAPLVVTILTNLGSRRS